MTTEPLEMGLGSLQKAWAMPRGSMSSSKTPSLKWRIPLLHLILTQAAPLSWSLGLGLVTFFFHCWDKVSDKSNLSEGLECLLSVDAALSGGEVIVTGVEWLTELSLLSETQQEVRLDLGVKPLQEPQEP